MSDTPSTKGPEQDPGADRPDATPDPGKLPDRPSHWLFCACLGVISALALIGALEFHYQIRRWPLILSSFILICLVFYAIEQMFLLRKLRAAGLDHLRDPVDPDYSARATAVTTVATAAFGLFLLVAYFFSFLVATLLFVPAYMWMTGSRHLPTLAGVTAGMLVAVWFLFGRILFVPVEAGRLLELPWLAP